MFRRNKREHTDEIWHEEEDVLAIGLRCREIDCDLCVDDVYRASSAGDYGGHGCSGKESGSRERTRSQEGGQRRAQVKV